MAGKFRVSVAMCTCDGRPFVEEQLASILSQTRPPDEVVVCDDASVDGTAEVVEAVATERPSVRLVRNAERLGIRANFEQAVGACRGDLVFLSDQDDVWLPRKVESMVAPFADESVGLVRCDALVVDEALRPRGSTLLDRHRRRARSVLVPFGVFGSAMAVRASLVPAVTPIPATWPHDVWIALVAGALGEEATVEVPLQLYRRHGTASSPARFVDLAVGDRLRGQLDDVRSDRYEGSIRRWEAVLDRLEAPGVAPLGGASGGGGDRLEEALGRARRWLDLSRFRDEVTARPHPARVLPVVRRLASGSYRLHGRPVSVALKDLVVRR